MSKPAKKHALKAAASRVKPARTTSAKSPLRPKAKTVNVRREAAEHGSKQSRVIEMLQSSTGTTIAAVMKATGWQRHSVRGFFAGAVRKRLKLNLGSQKIDGERIYRIVGDRKGKPRPAETKQRSA